MYLKNAKEIIKKYPEGINKLEFGSGDNPEPGYVHLDIRSSAPHLEILANVRQTPIPTNFVNEEIRAVHLLEHFCHPEYSSPAMRQSIGTTTEVLTEAYRILKPGAKLRIVTPDFAKICRSSAFRKIANYWLQRWTVGGHENEFDLHHWLWTKEDAAIWFSNIGFRQLNDWNPLSGKRKIKLQIRLLFQRELFQLDPELEWYHWLFFEGTK